MYRKTLFTLYVLGISLAFPLMTQAQETSDLIILNDTSPTIDVVINPSPDTTGVIAIEVQDVSVKIQDAVGNVVFDTQAPEIHGLEFHFAPNASTHTLTVERLPNFSEGYIRIQALPEMTNLGTIPNLVSSSQLALSQEADFPLNSSIPSTTVDLTFAESEGAITASFPNAPVTAQLVESGRPIATLQGSLIDGIRFSLNAGDYQLALLNVNIQQETLANISLLPVPSSNFSDLVAQSQASNTTTLVDTNLPASTATTSNCLLTVMPSSVNLRSGPGAGYSVLGYAFRGDNLAVGGVNTEGNWILVGTEAGSGWMEGISGSLSGSCDSLSVYNIPYREAPAPQVSIQQPQVSVYHDDDDDDEHEYEEHEEREDDDD